MTIERLRKIGWRVLAALVVFVIYGSLVPCDFHDLAWADATAQYADALAKPVTMHSKSDWAANILLFMPLGFVAAGTLTLGRRPLPIASLMICVPAFAAFSASIELVQLWFPPRNTNINDIAAETIGGILGMAVWLIAGERLLGILLGWAGSRSMAPFARWLPAYALLLVIVHGMPFDLTLSPGEINAKRKEGRLALNPADEQLPRKIVTNALFFVPLGVMLAAWRTKQGVLPVETALLVGVAFAFGIETMQVFVESAGAYASDAFVAAFSVGVGLVAARSRVGFAFPAWLAGMMILNAIPLDFTMMPSQLAERWSVVNTTPFADYFQGNYLSAFNAMLDKCAFFLVGGAAVALRPWLVILTVPLALEAWQLIASSRPASLSDVILGIVAMALGAQLARPTKGAVA